MRYYHEKTVGSLLTGNITDGEKTIFLSDVVGVQFKKSGGLTGYLQFETPSMQMNNMSDNMFSENTFTFENRKNGITNDLMEAVYNFVVDRIEELKYGKVLIHKIPDFESMKYVGETAPQTAIGSAREEDETQIPVGKQCQLCGNYVGHLTCCEVKDDFGTRYRFGCDECVKKFNARPKK